MTTMQKVDSALSRFDRKTPREAYAQVCEELGIHAQKHVSLMLSNAPRDWEKHRIFDCSSCLLGPKGCMAILPLVLCSRSLRRVTLCNCQVTDEFVTELTEMLQDHGCIRSVDISDNQLVTVYSANPVITLLRRNKNIVSFNVENTHMGDNVSNIINNLCDKNHDEVTNYYADDYFRMKNLFNHLDGDGSGWVLLRSLVLGTPYPVLQEQFIERIAVKRPKKRSDNTISVDTFMELVYTNYKTEAEIAKRESEMEDEEYQNIIFNWNCLLEAMEQYNSNISTEAEQHVHGDELGLDENEDCGAFLEVVESSASAKIPVAPPADLYRFRIRQSQLSADAANRIISLAVKLQATADEQAITENPVDKGDAKPEAGAKEKPEAGAEKKSDSGAEEKPEAGAEKKSDSGAEEKPEAGAEKKSDSGAEEKPEAGAERKSDSGAEEKPEAASEEKPERVTEEKPEAGGEGAPSKEKSQSMQLSIVCLRRAYRTVVRPEPIPNRFRFLREFDADYIPSIMREGSRMISLSKLSFLNESFASGTSDGGGSAGESEGVAFDDMASERWWALPPSLVRLAKKFFLQEVAKKPKRRQSTLVVSPRTQRDRAMQKADIPVAAFLSAEFVTELETVRPLIIADKFAQYAIPIEVSNITFQEMINCLDEYYLQARIDRPFSLEQIRAMEVPEARYTPEEGFEQLSEL